MSIFLVIINLIIFLLALLSLWVMAKKHVKFPKRVFFALGLGIVLGL
ncbi:L-cystine transporter, partial [Staphylococcus pseudintermedius]